MCLVLIACGGGKPVVQREAEVAPLDDGVRPVVVAQHAQTEAFEGSVSSDGSIVITATNSETYVWNTALARQVRQFKGPWRSALSNDGQTLMLYWDAEFKLCRLGVRDCKDVNAPFLTQNFWIDRHPSFTASDHHIWMSRGQLGESFLLRVEDAVMRRISGFVIAVDDRPDGSVTAYVVNLSDEAIYTYKWGPAGITSEPVKLKFLQLTRWNVDCAALSSDGARLLVGVYGASEIVDTNDPKKRTKLDLENGCVKATFAGRDAVVIEGMSETSPDKKLRRFDERGKPRATHDKSVVAINGGWSVTSDLNVIGPDGTERALEVVTSTPLVSSVSSPDGQQLLLAIDGRAWRWDMSDPRGAVQVPFGDPANPSVSYIAEGWSDHRLLVVSAERIALHDLAANAVTPLPDSASAGDGILVTSGDRTRVFQAVRALSIGKIWKVGGGPPAVITIPHEEYTDPDLIRAAAFSPSGRLLVTSENRWPVNVWDAETGRKLRHIVDSPVSQVAFLDENHVLTADEPDADEFDSSPHAARIWDLSSKTDPPRVSRVLGKRLWAMNRARTHFFIDGHVVDAAGKELWTLKVDFPSFAAIAEDGDRVALIEKEQWKLSRAKWRLRVFSKSGHVDAIPNGHLELQSVEFQGRYILRLTDTDGIVHIWRICDDAPNCRPYEICQIHAMHDGWVAVDALGRYDASNLEGLARLTWLFSDRTLTAVPADLFIRDYFVPGLVSRLISVALPTGRRERAPPKPPDLALADRSVPNVKIESVAAVACPTSTCATPRVKVKLDVTADGNARDAYNLRLLRDGNLAAESPLVTDAASALAQWRQATQIALGAEGRYQVELEIPLSARSVNTDLTAYAFNGSRMKGPTTHFEYKYTPPPSRRPRAYLVAIGVGPSGPDLDALEWAPKDAAQMIGFFESSLASTHQLVPIALISTGKCAPTRANILAVLSALAGTVPPTGPCWPAGTPSMMPDDALFLYVSAHGVSQGQELTVVAEGGERISSTELAHSMRALQSDHIKVILDTCESEAAVAAAGFRPAPLGDFTFGQLAFDKSMQILTASGQNQAAVGSEQLRGSLLVFSLREQLSNAPGKKMTSGDLLRSAVPAVPANFTKYRLPGQVQRPVMFDYGKGSDDVVLETR